MSKDNTDNNKDKVRVYEYAKQLNMSSKEVITILKRMNMPVNNHMSVMEDGMTGAVEKFFRDVKANAAAKMAQSAAKPADKRPAQGAASAPAQNQTAAPRRSEDQGQPARPAAVPASSAAAPTAPTASSAAPREGNSRPQGQGGYGQREGGSRPQGQGGYAQREGGSRPQGQG
ncbi:hypothetical protein SD71_14965, partial [Cohnella kolymensis]